MIRFIELFAGIGGFRLGLEKVGQYKSEQKRTIGQYLQRKRNNAKPLCGRKKSQSQQRYRLQFRFDCIWANEIDRYACQIYRKNFGNKELHEGDIREVKADDIPDHELLTAGFPCQSFSIAGKRGGFDDTRGTLFYEIARVLAAKRPPLLLLENVKGLLSHDNGNTFGTILTTLSDLGYFLQWQILNSKDFGVPQNRERVFIVGHLGEGCAKQIFPIQASNESSIKISMRGKHQQDIVYKTDGILNLPAGTHGSTPHLTKIEILAHRKGYRKNMQVFNPNGIIEALDTAQGGGRQKHTIVGGLQKHQIPRMDGISPCLPEAMGKGGGHTPIVSTTLYGFKYGTHKHFNDILPNKLGLIRRLTPTECERLQGFPDGWTKGVSDTQRYKMLGNAVTVNVIEAMGRLL